MSAFEITSLPQIQFAHVYGRESYHNLLPKNKRLLEISYIEQGELHLQMRGQNVRLKEGDVACVLHSERIVATADAFHCHHTVGALVDWQVSADEQSGLLLPLYIPAENNTTEVCTLIDRIIRHLVRYKTQKAKGAARFLELLCVIDGCTRRAQSVNQPGEMLYAARAKRYVERNLHAPITQREIAAALELSPEYLCAVFKKAEGDTLMRYINKLKLKNVKALMDSAGMRLYEAAAIYGYNDPNYVSRLYKQLYGCNITDP